MKYQKIDALVEAHVDDIRESTEDGSCSLCADVALATLLAIMATAHGGDTEKVVEDFDMMARYVRAGVDSGELHFRAYQ